MTDFRSINICMKDITALESKISSMKTRLVTLTSVIDKEFYIQENISITINSHTLQLSTSVLGATNIKSGADMVMLGVKKMLNAQLSELECKLQSAKEQLLFYAEQIN